MTPEEVWSGIKPSVEHFRVFGCVSHVHILDAKRTKLEDKSFSCVLLGVSEESKAYRLYDPVSKRIVGDNEEDTALNGVNEEDSDTREVGPDSSNNVNEESLSRSSEEGREERVRRKPVWMNDYESGEGLSEEEDVTNLEGFEKCHSEHTLFVKVSKEGKVLIVSIYVDDLIFTGDDEPMIEDFKNSMMNEFDMYDLGRMKYFLGIEVLQRDDGIFICQKKYAMEVLRFDMEESNSVLNPVVPGFKVCKDADGVKVDATFFKQVVGSLMYLTATRPDLMLVVSLISRYMVQPTEPHLQAAKRALRYLRGTTNFGIFYRKGGSENFVAYADSDYAGDLEDRKRGTVELVYCGTQEQVAAVMTKPLKLDVFQKLRCLLGVCQVPEVN
ncbi:hypothetical protein MRB53_002947 [Persea americana]|uniref:Uncharacterized protein n=1 Tax=Persea americana TaxID=3435 RepID=A0ACC2MW43_PERAE|nr:hypothetical protein MRB53_002947 [Persea americana]